ncbi:UdgX family uracil-DNA binding protein [Noviherbaspirillum galbum]|uniref:Type-4 uracil-DNA glycosylase n=1 Tax=Noviherbaspirillum galbum TaxID=2709383 RepID=A0A6B3SH91_9BURK|nr:UdgX family uracil-DNA binding protein [Noviherbaspirillum galbum]NEX60010.1 UdgX family uracil-DNA binding protein [Noviherbaspirillum galbum]
MNAAARTAMDAIVTTAPWEVATFDAWRAVARALLQRGVPPHAVQWRAPGQDGDLLDGIAPSGGWEARDAGDVMQASGIRLPRSLVVKLESASCFRAEDRWAFLYKIVWRWNRGEHEVVSEADIDGSRLHSMLKAIRREEHDMHAYVRFRERQEDAGPRFVAWYEPAHDVLPQVARHFAARMGNRSWMIATPDATAAWDGAQLELTGPVARGQQDIEDDGEALWLAYYRSIFNPSRLNEKLMQSHVPSRHWKNLPEGRVVPAMVADAATGARRVGQARTVGARAGAIIPITAERAAPLRPAATSLQDCRRCPLWQRATQAVDGQGNRAADVMLVGEQPGDQEDLQGKPFIGPAGQLLEEALARAALDRESLYLTNAVKHFKWEPRGKRRLHKSPAQQEVLACRHWLEQELREVGPRVVVALGSTALLSLVGSKNVKLTEVLGQALQHEGRWIVPIYHPAYVLRVPDPALKTRAMEVMVAGLALAKQLAGGDLPEPQEPAALAGI